MIATHNPILLRLLPLIITSSSSMRRAEKGTQESTAGSVVEEGETLCSAA